MHEPSFLAGLELGKFVTRLKRVEDGLVIVRKDLDALTGKMRRAAILATLWAFALLVNVSSDRAAEFAVEVIMTGLKR
jgi:hypothetical protein